MSIAQLNGARKLVEQNPQQFSVIVRSVLPVCDHFEAELRLWCAGFISDFFCAPSVDEQQKSMFSLEILEIIRVWLKDADLRVVKLAICILCEVYPRIYGLALVHGSQYIDAFKHVNEVKIEAFKLWTPSQTEEVVVACIKLTQTVVFTNQQSALNHPVLDNIVLTAEATGLLDRLLSIFPTPLEPEPLNLQTFGCLSASVNAAVSLALTQPHLAGKIVNYILTFDLSKRTFSTRAQQPLVLKWIGKLFKLSLHPLTKFYPQIPKYLSGLTAYCTNLSLKRRAEQENALSAAKRPKLVDKELPAGLQPYRALYTLVDNSMTNFNARDLQFDLAVSVAASGLENVDIDDLEERVEVIRKRIEAKETEFQSTRNSEPSNQNQNQVSSELNESGKSGESGKSNETGDSKETGETSETSESAETVESGPSRAALEVEVPDKIRLYDFVFNRLLGRAPIRLVSRLVARGLEADSLAQQVSLKKIYAQLVPEFRNELDSIVLWLTEVYYASGLEKQYFDLVEQVVEEIIPKLEIADSRVFVRLLSELPELSKGVVDKIKPMCLDPERAVIGFRAIKFLLMFKPPCRTDCLDLARELVGLGVASLQPVLDKYN